MDYTEELPTSYIADCVQDIITQLFNACSTYEDTEGRVFSDSFSQLYTMIELNSETLDLVTWEYMRKRVNARTYKRLDVFQEEMFLFFDQIRQMSYIEGDYKLKTVETQVVSAAHKIHRYSQLYRDTYELQRFFIQKRDELCKNGDLLLSGALNFKVNALDSHLSVTIGAQTFDEAEALLVDKRFKALEEKLSAVQDDEHQSVTNLCVGQFFYMKRSLVLTNVEPKLETVISGK